MSQAEVGLAELALGMWPSLVRPTEVDRSRSDDLNDPRRLLDVLPAAIYVTDADGRITYFNDAAAQLWGRRPRLRIDRWCGCWKLLRPDGSPLPHDQYPHFETRRRRKDGSLVDISLSISPVTDETGTIIGASKIARDVTEQKRREQQISLLAREADHRTNNLLAVAQATVHLTHADSAADLKKAIEGRLRELANAHGMMAQSSWAGADLLQLVIMELSPYFRDGDPRAQIDGPKLLLKPDGAQALAMAVHELATNAVKYGALSTAAGKVRVQWSLGPANRLSLFWQETGGPAVSVPRKEGFGTRAITRMLGQLDGEVKFNWLEEGLTCDVVVTI
ncbi:MAG TPA: HWE histidine kinase domain-containing protein [Xanthobacteraceae bacterium]|jgi:two-component sensor histidine kinase|nr:HWE histidine kinase domain-containing protein [Xanthobacteraceae bacterium]